MEHDSSRTQEYSLWSAELATHMLLPVQTIQVFITDRLEFLSLYIFNGDQNTFL
jgi:hypothetical protein